MKRLLASKLGFTFLVISLLLASMLVLTIRYDLRAWSGTRLTGKVVMCSNGFVSFSVTNHPRPLGGRIDLSGARISKRVDPWIWSSATWPSWMRNLVYADGTRRSVFLLPIWMLLLPTASASWFFYRRAFRRIRLIGRCHNCEYDLTGNTSGVCPECGAPIPVRSAN